MIKISLLFGLLILLADCRKDPDPEAGFTESLYFSFDFMGENFTWEGIERTDISWDPNEGGHVISNVFESAAGIDMTVGIHFGEEVEASSIKALENTSVAASDGKGFPFISIYWENGSGEGFANTLGDVIDYGSQTFEINQLTKSKKVDYKEPLSGEEKKGRSYVIRGNFDINLSKSSWSAGEPAELFPVSNGIFSLRVFHP